MRTYARTVVAPVLFLIVIMKVVPLLRADVPHVPSGAWNPTGAMTLAGAGAAATLMRDGRVLMTGGLDAAGAVSATSERYSPDGGQFVQAAPMTAARTAHTSTLLADGRVLVAGGVGADGAALSSVEIYDPVNNSWTAGVPLNVARSGHTATALNDGRIVVVGGEDRGAAIDAIEVYNPQLGVFILSGASVGARTDHAAALLHDGTVLIVGGVSGMTLLASTAAYDPATDSITAGPALATSRAGHSATTLLSGKVLVAGGAGAGGDLASAEVYDPATKSFAGAGSMLAARQRHLAILLPHNNQVLIVGGMAGAAVTTTELYVPWQGGGTFVTTNAPANTSRTWAAGAGLSFNASETVRTGPNDGLLLLAGGSANANASAPTTSAELYGFATVRTDQADYSPGTRVVITGSGFAASEQVEFTLAEEPYLDTHMIDPVVADGSGNIFSDQFIPDAQDAGIKFYLTATGLQSHLEAQTTFTDANCTSAQSGAWNSASTWTSCGGGFPGNNDTATVNAGHTVTLTANQSIKDITIGSGGTLALGSNTLTVGGTWANSGTFNAGTGTVNYSTNGAQTVAAENYFNLNLNGSHTGNSNLTLASAGTIRIAGSLTLTGLSFGNGTLVTAGSTIEFNGSGAQTIPVLTTAIPNATYNYNNLAINKPSGTATLGGNVALGGTLALSSGIVTTGANTLTIAASGSFTGGSSTSYVDGKLARVYGAIGSKTFPIGKGGNFRPLTFNYTALTGTSTVTAEQFETGFPGTPPSGTTQLGTRYWNVTQTGGSAFTYNITLDPTGLSPSGTVVILKRDGGTTASLATTTPNYTATGLTTLSDFALGQILTSTTTTASDASAIYGDASVTLNATVTPTSGTVGVGTVTFTVKNGSFVVGTATSGTVSVNAASASFSLAGVSAGTYTVEAAYSGGTGFNASNNSSQIPAPTLTVSSKNLTVTGLSATSRAYNGGTVATITGTPTLSGVVGADDVSITGSATGNFASKNAGTHNVTVTGLSLAGTDKANYSLTQPTLSATITAASLTVTFAVDGRPYNGTTAATIKASPVPALSGTIYNSDDVTLTGIGTATATFGAAGVGLQTATSSGFGITGAAAGNYSLTQGTATATITVAPLTVTFAVDGRPYNGTTAATIKASPVPALSGTIYNSDDVSLTGSGTATATFGAAGVGLQTATSSGFGITGTGAGNYSFSQGTATATITGAPLTVTFAVDGRPYNGTTAATIKASPVPALSGTIYNSDDVTLTGIGTATATFGAAGVGLQTATSSGFGITGAAAGNYSFTQGTATATITAAPLTVTFAVDGRPYNGTTAATIKASPVPALSGTIYNSDDVSLTGSGTATATFGAAGVGLQTATSSGFGITGTGAGNYSFSQGTATATITGAPLTVTFAVDGRPYNGTTAATIKASPVPALSGTIYNSDDVTLTGIGTATATFGAAGVGLQTATSSGFGITGATAGNYSFSQGTATATITPAPLTVTFAVDGRPYNGTTTATIKASPVPALTGTVYGSDVVTLTGIGTATATFGAAGVGLQTATSSGFGITGAAAGNYSFSQGTATATITPAPLTVTFAVYGRPYNGTTNASIKASPVPALSGTIYNSDDVSLTGIGTATATFGAAGVGLQTATSSGFGITGAAAGNYSFSQGTATATITPAPLTVTFAVDGRPYNGTTTATIKASPVPALTGTVYGSDVVTLTGIGTATATFGAAGVGLQTATSSGFGITGAAAGNYSFSQGTATATITPAPLTVTFVVYGRPYNGTTNASIKASPVPALSGTIYNSDDVSLTGIGTATATFGAAGVGLQTATSSGFGITGTGAGNYSFSQGTATATITPAPLTVTFAVYGRPYNGTTNASIKASPVPALSGTIYNSDDVSVTGIGTATATFGAAGVGLQTATSSGFGITGTGAGNYSFSQGTATATITAAPLTVTFAVDGRPYNGTTAATIKASPAPALSGTVYVAGEVSLTGVGTATATFGAAGVGLQTATSSGFGITGTGAGNYSFSQGTATATITTAPLTVTFAVDGRPYNGTTNASIKASPVPALSGTIYGSDVVTLTGIGTATATFGAAGAGLQTATSSGFGITGTGAGNYSFSQGTATATITAAPLTVTFAVDGRPYNGTTAATIKASPAPALSGTVYVAGEVSLTGIGTATATFGAAGVGLQTATSSGFGITGTGAGNYSFSQGTATATITAAPLTVTFAVYGRPYNGTTAATIKASPAPTLSGTVYVAGEVSLTGVGTATASFGAAGVGLQTATSSSFGITGTGAGNYSFSQGTATATIMAAPLTVTFAVDGKVYNGTTTATIKAVPVPSLSGTIYGSDVVTLTGIGTATATFGAAGAGLQTATSSGFGITGTGAGNYSFSQGTATATITPATPTITVLANPNPVQVSDHTLITPNAASAAPGLTGTFTIKFDGAVIALGAAPGAPFDFTVPASTPPANYTLTAEFTSATGNFNNGTPATLTLAVLPENGSVRYVGTEWIATNSQGQATLLLTAYVGDDPDGAPGDLRYAKVTFVNRDATNAAMGSCKDVRIDVADAAHPTTGIATCTYTVSLGKSEEGRLFNIGVIARYSHSVDRPEDNAAISVVRALPGSISGGGTVQATNPVSMYQGTVAPTANFGFDVVYNKSQTSLQGMANVKFTVGGRTYLAKGNSLLNLTVGQDADPLSASFTSKASIIDATTGASIDGNAIIELSLLDGGTDDNIAITIYGKNGGVIYSNNWTPAGKTDRQDVATGNILVNPAQ